MFSLRQGIWKYIKNYKLQSVFVKYFLLLIILLVIPISAFFFISNYIYDKAFEAEMRGASSNFISQVSIIMDETVNNVSNQLNFMSTDNNLLFFMSSEDENDYSSYDTNLIKYLMEIFRVNFSYIENVHIYSAKSNRVISLHGGGMLDTIDDNTWYEEYKENHEKHYWISKRNIGADNSRKIISIFQVVKNFNEVVGVIVANIDMYELLPSIIPEDSNFESLVFLDNYGNELFSSGDIEPFDFEYIKQLDLSKPLSIIKNDKSKKINTYLKSAKTEWYYISNETYADVSQHFEYIHRLKVIVIAFTIVFSLIFSIFISYKLFIPFKSVIEIIQSSPSIRKHMDNGEYRNEIAFITERVSKTILEKDNYEAELKEKLKIIKNAQMSALQAQINPHFLYNTITTIRYLTMNLTGGENEASKSLSSLGRLFQMSLEGGGHFTTVDKETEHVKQYLQLQKVRYRGKLDAQFYIDDKVLSYKTIKIILQPIVENAIYHGIKPMEEKGIIKISGYTYNNRLIFEISDNGVGMSDVKIKTILKNCEKDEHIQTDHIGIYNVNQRLKLIFGTQYGLSIKSKLGEGTTILLEMPIIEN